MDDFKDKVVVVTGAGGGLGRAHALEFARRGARLVINDLGGTADGAGQSDMADQVVAEIRALGGIAIANKASVADRAGAQSIIDDAVAEYGTLDILINNAGMQHRGPLEDFEVDAFDRLMRTNVNSAFYVGQAVGRHMISRNAGRIINIASVQTALARPGIAPYTASKGAIANLTKGMATDWAKHGLNCNAIAPGYFDTPLNAALVADPTFSEWLEKRTPAGRWGKVEELVGAAIFLSSPASSFVNGQTIFVDGGITASL